MSVSLFDLENPFSCSKITVLGLITLGKRDCCNLRVFLLLSLVSGARKMIRLSGLLEATVSLCSCSWSFAYFSNCNTFSLALICISISFIPINEFTSVLNVKFTRKWNCSTSNTISQENMNNLFTLLLPPILYDINSLSFCLRIFMILRFSSWDTELNLLL